jgi:Beta-propeller repeat
MFHALGYDAALRLGATDGDDPMTTSRLAKAEVVGVPISALVVVAVIAGLALVGYRDPRASRTDAPSTSVPSGQTCPRVESTPQAPVSVTTPAGNGATRIASKIRNRFHDAYRNLPLSFVTNAGQTDSRARYYARGDGFGFYFTPDEVILKWQTREQVVHLKPLGISSASTLEGRSSGSEKVNYFVGSSRHTNLEAYHEIAYRDLWPGIDMVFRGQGGKLTYEFQVAPGADPSLIRVAYEGAGGVSLRERGEFQIDTRRGKRRDPLPRSYQHIDGERVGVESRYQFDGTTKAVGFALGSFDRHHPLVIDPGSEYSTYLGGTSNDFGIEIAVDNDGSAYVTGQTISADFPSSTGAFDTSHGGLADAFVVKLDASGSNLVYATYLGGGAAEAGLAIAVDSSGSAYVSGGSASPDFPTTVGALDTSHNGNEDVWVAKLSADGSALMYSTFLGGSQIAGDFGAAIAVDGAGSAYVSGGSGSPDFPTTEGSFDASHNGEPNALDAFIAKLNAEGSALVYSTFLGGTCNDAVTGIAVDEEEQVYATGSTVSADLPTTGKANDRRYSDREDAFVAKLDRQGSALVYSTYLGGSALDKAQGIAIDKKAQAYVTGWTTSRNFPTTGGALAERHNGGEDGFVTKLNAKGSGLVYSTYLGGGTQERGNGIAVDSAESAYVTGTTASPDFPTTRSAVARHSAGGEDGFVAKLNAKGSDLVYSTYLGGTALDFGRSIAVDQRGSAYVAGRTESPDFPTTPNALRTSSAGGREVFVTKLDPRGR